MNLLAKIKKLEIKLKIGSDSIAERLADDHIIYVPDGITEEEAFEKHIETQAKTLNVRSCFVKNIF